MNSLSLSPIPLRFGCISPSSTWREIPGPRSSLCSGPVLVQLWFESTGCSFDAVPEVASREEVGMSHTTGRRNLPIWIEQHSWNLGFSALLCHLHCCTAAQGACTLPGGSPAEEKQNHSQPRLIPYQEENWDKGVFRDWKDQLVKHRKSFLLLFFNTDLHGFQLA